MNQATLATGDRRLTSDVYEHDFDRKALKTLKRIPAFPFIVRKMNEMGFERMSRIACTGSYLRITPRNFPELYQLLQQACDILAIDKLPLFYVEPEGTTVQSYALGVEQTIIVVNRYAVDFLSQEELLFVIGHELGHIKSEHMLYTQMASYFPALSNAIGNVTLGIGSLATSGVELALLHWSRMAEFTADRAGLLTCQDMGVATQTMLKLAGLPEKYVERAVMDDFIAQAREFDDYNYDNLDKLAKVLSTLNRTHPWTVFRVAELLKWIDAGEYAQALGHFLTDSSMPVRAKPSMSN